MRTKARIRFRKLERQQRQISDQLRNSLTGDQRRILLLSAQGYGHGEIARELALPEDYVVHFALGMVQRLNKGGIIPSPEWRHVLAWAEEVGIIG